MKEGLRDDERRASLLLRDIDFEYCFPLLPLLPSHLRSGLIRSRRTRPAALPPRALRRTWRSKASLTSLLASSWGWTLASSSRRVLTQLPRQPLFEPVVVGPSFLLLASTHVFVSFYIWSAVNCTLSLLLSPYPRVKVLVARPSGCLSWHESSEWSIN